MILTKRIKAIVFTGLLAFTAVPVSAQDLLARQVPTDRAMRAVDTLALQNLLEMEMSGAYVSELYEDWNNRYAHKQTAMPDTFTIDLRHFCMPTKSRVITSNFGARWGRAHKGLDIKVYTGDTIRAAFSGKVRMVKYEGAGYGKYIVIRHPNGLETIYGHLSKQLVRENQEVRAGDVIGLGGNTGRSTGSHLHFETRLCGMALNPALMFDFRAQDVTGDTYTYRKRTYARESAAATRARGMIGNGSYTREEVQGTMARTGSRSTSGTKQSAYKPAASQPMYHKVQSGETLYSISRKRGVSVDELCKLNHFSKNIKVKVGQIIRYS